MVPSQIMLFKVAGFTLENFSYLTGKTVIPRNANKVTQYVVSPCRITSPPKFHRIDNSDKSPIHKPPPIAT